MKNPLRTGVVLSSGGGRGVFAHTGFLLALKELGIDIAAISGCSAGALVGGICASGTNIQLWSEALKHVHTREYWAPDSWLRIGWNLMINQGRGYTGISGSEKAVEFIRNNLGVQMFEQCQIPFHCLAMNLSSREKEIFNKGDLATAIMASAAMPLLYRPVKIGGQYFSDGAVIELASTEAICCQHDLDVLIVHHTSVHRDGSSGLAYALRQPWTMVELLYLQLYNTRPWYLTGQPMSTHKCKCGCGATVIVLEPDLPELAWPLSVGGVKVQSDARQQAIDVLRSSPIKWKKHAQRIGNKRMCINEHD